MRECVRCGKELTKWQRKYCNECSHVARREYDRKFQKGRKEKKSYQKKNVINDSNHLEWEADICLNCKRPSCNNCLNDLTMEEKQERLDNCGGKKWLD